MSRIIHALVVLCGLCPFVCAAPPVAPDQECRANENTNERLAAKLREAIPGSRIDVIPNTRGGVILAGCVPTTKDIATAATLAEKDGANFVNFIRRERIPRVRLDVVVVELPIGESANGQREADGLPTELRKGIIGEERREAFLALLRSKKRFGIVGLSNSIDNATPASFFPRGEASVPIPVLAGSPGGPIRELVDRLTVVPTTLPHGRVRLQSEVDVVALPAKEGVGRSLQLRTAEVKEGQTLVVSGRGWVVLVTPSVEEETATEAE